MASRPLIPAWALADKLPCAGCGRRLPVLILDAKPSTPRFRLERQRLGQAEALARAADRNEEFGRLECQDCYGPVYSKP